MNDQQQYQYSLVDVFTEQPFSGAQITVFTEADGLNDTQMQAMASETNHSDTVFVVPSGRGNTARLKVFSPQGEREVGSHTTVAAAFALAETGKISVNGAVNRLRFEQGQREFPVLMKQSDRGLMTQIGLAVEPQIDPYVPDSKELQQILGLQASDMEVLKTRPLFVSCDTPYLIVPLRSLDAVYRAAFHAEAWAQSSASSVPVNDILVCCRETETTKADFHLRLLGPGRSRQDDPPVGAAIPAFAAYLVNVQKLAGGTHALWIERGRSTKRQSLLKVEFDQPESSSLSVRVGGSAVLVGEGRMRCPG